MKEATYQNSLVSLIATLKIGEMPKQHFTIFIRAIEIIDILLSLLSGSWWKFMYGNYWTFWHFLHIGNIMTPSICLFTTFFDMRWAQEHKSEYQAQVQVELYAVGVQVGGGPWERLACCFPATAKARQCDPAWTLYWLNNQKDNQLEDIWLFNSHQSDLVDLLICREEVATKSHNYSNKHFFWRHEEWKTSWTKRMSS